MTPERALRALAADLGVIRRYRASTGELCVSSDEALLGVVRALGIPIDSVGEAEAALLEHRAREHATVLDPVVVANSGRSIRVDLRHRVEHALRAVVLTEDGREVHAPIDVSPTESGAEVIVRAELEIGVHQLQLESARVAASTTLLVAPKRLERPGDLRRSFGFFAPVYALGRDRIGTFADLENLGEFTAHVGGRFAATLPILAAFLDQPLEVSPYAPVSRCAWNEIYLDPARIPFIETDQIGSGSAERLVDIERAAREVEQWISKSAADAMNSPIATDLDEYLRRHPHVTRYARFRAAGQRHGREWERWGENATSDVDPDIVRYHEYAQFLCERQLTESAARLSDRGVALLLDLPVGTHRDGFDTFDAPSAYCSNADVGVPPDAFFAAGQNWGFRPPHPQGARRDGYAAFRRVLDHHLRHARMLRIDHVLGFHRLWWIPDGASAADGAYVRYPERELFAVAQIEASRRNAVVIGEDLGTVPAVIETALARYGIHGVSMMQFGFDPTEVPPVPVPRRRHLASIGTHDTPTFAGWFEGTDIEHRVDLGIDDPDAVGGQRAQRAEETAAVTAWLADAGYLRGDGPPDAAAVLGGLLRWLGESRAEFVMVPLEDLCLEETPQNVPGTGPAREENWRQRLAVPLDELTADPVAVELVSGLAQARIRGASRAQ